MQHTRDSLYRAELSLFAEMFLDQCLVDGLKQRIDNALDRGDREVFMVLTEQLKEKEHSY